MFIRYAYHISYRSGCVRGQYAGGIIAGGQDKGTPHARISNVTAINRSVNGSRQTYAVMPIIDGDTLSHIGHSSQLYMNGKRAGHGLSDKELKERLAAGKGNRALNNGIRQKRRTQETAEKAI